MSRSGWLSEASRSIGAPPTPGYSASCRGSGQRPGATGGRWASGGGWTRRTAPSGDGTPPSPAPSTRTGRWRRRHVVASTRPQARRERARPHRLSSQRSAELIATLAIARHKRPLRASQRGSVWLEAGERAEGLGRPRPVAIGAGGHQAASGGDPGQAASAALREQGVQVRRLADERSGLEPPRAAGRARRVGQHGRAGRRRPPVRLGEAPGGGPGDVEQDEVKGRRQGPTLQLGSPLGAPRRPRVRPPTARTRLPLRSPARRPRP